MKKALTYDDVNIIPKYSELGSRSNIDLKTNFTKKTKLNIPIVSSPMDTITEYGMAYEMMEWGGVGVLHRFNTIEHQVKMVNNVFKSLHDISIEEAKKYGLSNYLIRSKKLSSDNASIIDVIDNAIQHLEKEKKLFFDYLLLTEPTSPFRLKKEVYRCIKIAIKNKAYSVFTVSKLDSKFHPIKILKKKNIFLIFFIFYTILIKVLPMF